MNATNESMSDMNVTNYDEHLTMSEIYFYILNGGFGSVFNLVVLFIAIRHVDTYDKPRQVGIFIGEKDRGKYSQCPS